MYIHIYIYMYIHIASDPRAAQEAKLSERIHKIKGEYEQQIG